MSQLRHAQATGKFDWWLCNSKIFKNKIQVPPTMIFPLIFAKCCYYLGISSPTNPAVFEVDIFMSSDQASRNNNNYDAIISFADPNYDLRNGNAINLNPSFQDISCNLPNQGRNISDPTSQGGVGQTFFCQSTRNPARFAPDCQIGFNVQETLPDLKTGQFAKAQPKNVTIYGEVCTQQNPGQCKYFLDPTLIPTALGDINLYVLITICVLGATIVGLFFLWYYKWRVVGFPWKIKKTVQINEDIDEQPQINVETEKFKKRTPEFYLNFAEKYKNEYQ